MPERKHTPEVKSISDVLKHKPFYPELNKVDKLDYVGKPIILYDWLIIKDWNSNEFGSSSFALVAFGEIGTTEPLYTCIVSGVVVLKKLAELRRKGIAPVSARLIKEETKAGNEMWNLV